jgi:aspartate aminotransferase-like enzyme
MVLTATFCFGLAPHYPPLTHPSHACLQVVATIEKERPGVVFAPHVETSTGMILPDDYIMKLSKVTPKT